MALKRGLRHGDALLATWFGAGLAPWAPGTVGSAAALPLGYAVALAGGAPGLLAAAAAIFAIGVWAAASYGRATGRSDPKEVVIDEVAGQLLPLAVVPIGLAPWAAAFLFFRLFDILKPWPCSYLDRRLHGGFGVMADDVAAGVYAAICVAALSEMGAW